ncbi:MAG TPA: type II toxin-antitoxin system RelE/ParE family toxin [Planctomycetota bacterium]|nr:type II toxin-antitoxin system RelE/ParE family toxin [Planctomycetota bacterium]
MSLPLVILHDAEADIAEAKQWYEHKRQGLGDEFVLCLEEALDRICQFPESARVVLKSVRRIGVRRFPYGVFYRIESKRIEVMAVYHSHRDPRGWKERA